MKNSESKPTKAMLAWEGGKVLPSTTTDWC